MARPNGCGTSTGPGPAPTRSASPACSSISRAARPRGSSSPARRPSAQARAHAQLNGLRDEEKDEIGINELFDTEELYEGPYLVNAPDLLVGYNHGYRVSWDCATGMVNGPVFEDNVKAWSGDHGVDPRIVPGVLFSNRDVHDDDPALMDIAPTALSLFGIEPPAHMDGKPLFERQRFAEEGLDAA